MSTPRVYDAGSELSYNRRRGAPPITLEKYLSLNETARAVMALKSALWPRPRYQRLVASGADPFKARLLKEIYDTLPTHAPAGAKVEDYAAGMIAVRNGVAAWLLAPVSETVDAAKSRRNYHVRQALEKEVFCTVWPEADAGKVRDIGYGSYGGAQETALRHWPDWTSRGQRGLTQLSFDDTNIYSDVERGWPKPLPAWYRSGLRVVTKDSVEVDKFTNEERYFMRCESETHGDFVDRAAAQRAIDAMKAFVLFDTNRFKTRRKPLWEFLSFDTEEEAIAEAKALAKRRDHAKEWTPPPLTVVGCEFEGVDTAPEHLTSETLIGEFGLKGINFGNYVTQKERMWHLRQAWNALHDLADVLGVDETAWLGHFGRLGLAIGAQGRGLKRAAAHYVPGFEEINLTRGSGVGSLAHEYGHSIDNAASETLGHAVKGAEFLSGRVGLSEARLRSGHTRTYTDVRKDERSVRDPLKRAMAELFHRLCWKQETEDEFAGRLTKEKGRAATDLERALQTAAERVPELEKELLSLNAELSASGCPSMEELRENRALRAGFAGLRRQMLQITGRCRRVQGAGLASFYAIRSSESVFAFTPEGRVGKKGPEERQTEFYNNALALDGGRKPYWATPHELFARAFADWVGEALKRKGRRNDYLTRNCREAYAEATSEGKTTGNPHLSARELEWIYPAMERLVNVIVALPALAQRKEQASHIDESLPA